MPRGARDREGDRVCMRGKQRAKEILTEKLTLHKDLRRSQH